MDLIFSNTSKFISDLDKIIKSSDPHASKIIVRILQNKPHPSRALTDLFNLSCFLQAILNAHDFGLHTVMQFDISKRGDQQVYAKWKTLGLPGDIFSHALTIRIIDQEELPSTEEMFDWDKINNVIQMERRIENKKFWRVLVPFTKIPINKNKTEYDVNQNTYQILSELAEAALQELKDLHVSSGHFGTELSKVLFIIAHELLSNSFVHSASDNVYISLVIIRDSTFAPRWSPSHQEMNTRDFVFDLIVFDSGIGLLNSVKNTLLSKHKIKFWDDLKKISEDKYDSFYEQRERSLLESLFNSNDLLVRRGRKSEGLRDIANVLKWFQGQLNIRTGATESAVTCWVEDNLLVTFRNMKKDVSQVHLPGVIFSAWLPTMAITQKSISHIIHHPGTAKLAPVVFADKIGARMFGHITGTPMRRRSESIASSIHEIVKNAPQDALIAIDLRASNQIDINIFDGVLQELIKLNSEIDQSILNRVLFINVPRNLVNLLKLSTADALLRMSGDLAVILDENNFINYLGIPYTQYGSRQIEDVFRIAANTSRINLEAVGKKLRIDNHTISYIREMFKSENELGLCTYEESSDNIVSINPIRSLVETYKNCLIEIGRHIVKEKEQGYLLNNGECLDSIIDFDSLWANDNNRRAATRLLIPKVEWSRSDRLIAFLDNGDVLATELQKQLSIPELIFVDPKDSDHWASIANNGMILVLDVLYPGDNEKTGYLYRFLDTLKSNAAQATQIVVAYDLRGDKTSLINNVPIVTALEQNPNRSPKQLFGTQSTRHLKRGRLYKYTGYEYTPTALKEDKDKRPSYSEIELSTDFWQSVFHLNILSNNRIGREQRNILFHENNEKLIQHARLRRYVVDFITGFVGQELRRQVDVILHPAHAVGRAMSSWASNALNGEQTTISIYQPDYGGELEIQPSDISRWKYIIKKRIGEKRKRPRVVIFDDSVLSGHSLHTMIGLSRELNLELVGVAVLFNRLAPEISASIAAYSVPFRYLCRLHMPIMQTESYLNSLLDAYSTIYKHSAYARHYYRWLQKGNDPLSDILLKTDNLVWVNHTDLSDFRDPSESVDERLKTAGWVLEKIILHRDPQVLSFSARVAATYNFIGVLKYHSGFWELLRTISTGDLARQGGANFTNAILLILSLSNELSEPEIFTKFEDTAKYIIDGIESDTVTIDKRLYALISLSVSNSHIGSSDFGKDVLFEVLSKINTDEVRNNELGVFSAMIINNNISALSKAENETLFNSLMTQTKQSCDDKSKIENMLFDILDIIGTNLKIPYQRIESEELIELVNSNTKADHNIRSYLETAPGYSCSLAVTMRICRSSAIVLYAKNREDQQFFVRAVEKEGGDWKLARGASSVLSSDVLSSFSKSHMLAGVPFISRKKTDMDNMRALSGFDDIQAIIGGCPLTHPDDNIDYYIVLIYKYFENDVNDSVILNTYYWNVCAKFLGIILPKIHASHIETSSTWTSLIQSMATSHPVDSNKYAKFGTLKNKREAADEAIRFIRSQDDELLQAVEAYSQRVHCLKGIRQNLKNICFNIKTRLNQQKKLSYWEESITELDALATGLSDVSERTEPIQWFSAYHGVLRYIFYEVFKNAMTFAKSQITLNIDLRRTNDKDQPPQHFLHLIVRNDISSTDRPTEASYGLMACTTAARTVGGDITIKEDDNQFIIKVKLPVYMVPQQLQYLFKLL